MTLGLVLHDHLDSKLIELYKEGLFEGSVYLIFAQFECLDLSDDCIDDQF